MPKKVKNTTYHAANRGNSYQDQLPAEHETLENGSLSPERVEYTSGIGLLKDRMPICLHVTRFSLKISVYRSTRLQPVHQATPSRPCQNWFDVRKRCLGICHQVYEDNLI